MACRFQTQYNASIMGSTGAEYCDPNSKASSLRKHVVVDCFEAVGLDRMHYQTRPRAFDPILARILKSKTFSSLMRDREQVFAFFTVAIRLQLDTATIHMVTNTKKKWLASSERFFHSCRHFIGETACFCEATTHNIRVRREFARTYS